MDSIWETDVKMPQFPELKTDLKVDVLIIGGGIAGLLCAWNLKNAGVNCVLVEQNRLMSGVSGRTTAKLTSQHGVIYSKLLNKFGANNARLYYEANQKAVEGLSALAKSANCDFLPQNSYIYSTGEIDTLKREMEAYRCLGIPVNFQKTLALPFSVTGVLEFQHQAQFNPLKTAVFLAKGLNIYENTKVLSFSGKCVETKNGKIMADKIIVATHFPIFNKHGGYFLKLYQQRSYVLALENAPKIEGMYLDVAENGLSIRNSGKYLLLGGGGHRTGKTGLDWQLAERYANRYFKNAKIVTRWATQDCVTLDSMPYIGNYSKSTPNLYVATGFNKWGMSSSYLSAMILTDLIMGKENPYANLFSPQRSIFHKQLGVNGIETVTNLLRPTVPRCPHLGCALKWNKSERSWDCSCHGSRFDENGKVLNNPATDDLPINPKER